MGYGQGMNASMYGQSGSGHGPPMMNMSMGGEGGMEGGRGKVVLLVSNLPDSVANVNSIFNLLGRLFDRNWFVLRKIDVFNFRAYFHSAIARK